MKKEDFQNTKIRVRNEAESIEFQEAMFKLEFRWEAYGDKSKFIREPFLFIGVDFITFSESEPHFNNHQHKEITIESIRPKNTVIRNKKNVSPGDTIEIKKVCRISQGWYNIGDTFPVKDVLQKGVMVEVESDLPYIYIKNKEFRVYPKISDKRLNEFACPLENYFGDVIKDLDNSIEVRKNNSREVDLNEPILGNMLVDKNGKLILSHDFDTVGIITDSERFFYEKIKGYRNDKLRMFVMIKDEKSTQGHKFAFIVMDSNFEGRHDLLEICEFNRM